jgi:hypothetical protein
VAHLVREGVIAGWPSNSCPGAGKLFSMSDEPENLIEFHYGTDRLFPQPCPSARGVPPWLKKMPAEAPGASPPGAPVSTVKKCAPFLDAITCGYVVPIVCDVHFFMRDATHLEYQQAGPVIQTHDSAQYQGSPFADRILVKFVSPWIVKTPPGYSTLFLPLLNQFTIPFQILAGLVDTDTYYGIVNFPSICTMFPGQKFDLPAGTPIVQAIPIKREAWHSKIAFWDEEKAKAQSADQTANPHFYKDDFWIKKDYR